MARSAPKSRKPLQAISESMHKGGLHETTGTPMGQKIPAAKEQAARRGAYGPKGVKQAILDETFAKHRKGGE